MTELPPGAPSPAVSDAELTREEALGFLADCGDGVVSLAGDPPLSLPMSFAVLSGGRLLLQSLSGPDSEKARRIGDGVGASVVAYERSSPDDWVSAVATGELAAVDRTAERDAAFASQANSVGLSVFRAEAADLDSQWYELRAATVTGRRGPARDAPNKFGETR